VVHLLEKMQGGGAEQYIYLLSTAERRLGALSEIITVWPGGPVEARALAEGIVVRSLFPKQVGKVYSPIVLFRLLNLLRQAQPDVVNIHGAGITPYGILSAKLARVPVTMVSRYCVIEHFSKAHWLVDRISIRWVSGLMCNAQVIRDEYCQALPRLRSASWVMKNPVNPVFCEITVNGEGGIISSQKTSTSLSPLFTVIGRLVPQKGHEYFLQAARLMLDIMPNARFLIVGEGPLETKLKRLTAELALDDAVEFLPYQMDLRTIYARSYAVVLPSLYEGVPVVLNESMSMGVPVIATNVSGIPEHVVDGQNGLLVPARDAQSLGLAMLKLAKKPELRSSLSLGACKYSIEKGSPDDIGVITLSIYKELLTRQRSA
jgi:glycosyltransferase involved in cell wall biosynthesis